MSSVHQSTGTRNRPARGPAGDELGVTNIARRAGVDRTFIYRHRDQLEHIHAAETQPPDKPGTGPAVTRASLQADLLVAQQRCTRMATRTQHSRHACPNYSANRSGEQADSAHPPTSTSSTHTSSPSNNKSSTSGRNSKNTIKRPRRRPRRQPRTYDNTQRLTANRLTRRPKPLHYTCCTPYSSTISYTTSGNAVRRQPLQAETPRETPSLRTRLPHSGRHPLRLPPGTERGLKLIISVVRIRRGRPVPAGSGCVDTEVIHATPRLRRAADLPTRDR
jgi:hypothetical protein